jgi:acyl-CoA thioesterase FadM
LDGLVETYRGGVAAWECDVFGHLNIAFYVERLVDAAEDLLARHAPGRRFRTLALDTRYEHELRAGDGIAIQSGIIAIEPGALRIGHEAVNSVTGERTTFAVHRLAPAAGDPPLLAGAVCAWSLPDFPTLDLPAGQGAIPAGRDRVRPPEALEGTLSLLGILHRFSGACLHAIDAIGMTGDYRRAANCGFATFETRLELAPAQAVLGDGVVVTSGIVEIGTSSLRMLHRLATARDATPLARCYQAGVHFDLAARRASPWPPEMRAKATALRIAK